MAVISDATEEWSAGTTITKAEFWQCRAGAFLLTTESSPAAGDGAMIEAPYGIDLQAGVTVKYRKLTGSPCIITRTATST